MASKGKEWSIYVTAANSGTTYRSTECRAQQLLEDLTKVPPYLLVHRMSNSYNTTCDIIPVSSISSIKAEVR